MPPPAGRATPPPLLEGPAAQAIRDARDRVYGGRPRFPVPVRTLTEQERAAAHEVKDKGCRLCGGIHPLPNTPACPRVAEYKATSDGTTIIEAKFWQDGEWDSSRVLFLVDAAEEPAGSQGEEAG